MALNRKPHELRIIAGTWRGRRFPVLDQPGLRPTPNRVRETLFNWLQHAVVGARCLDMFAGSGALGLEALSRGAAHVTFMDNNPLAISQLREVLTRFNAANATTVLCDATSTLSLPAEPYDIVFLDPPFDAQYLPQIITTLANPGWLRPDAYIYLETATTLTTPTLPPTWHTLREKVAGQVSYRLIQQG